ncbi:MAG: hypothetical protein IT497_03740 [Ottowia sp.]|nr:hypothetical protein [Ottowia sp.]
MFNNNSLLAALESLLLYFVTYRFVNWLIAHLYLSERAHDRSTPYIVEPAQYDDAAGLSIYHSDSLLT